MKRIAIEPFLFITSSSHLFINLSSSPAAATSASTATHSTGAATAPATAAHASTTTHSASTAVGGGDGAAGGASRAHLSTCKAAALLGFDHLLLGLTELPKIQLG